MTSLVIFAKDPNVQFRPNLCPYCRYFAAGGRKCEAFEITYAMGDKGPAPLYNSTFEHCEKFQRRAGGNVHFFEGLTAVEAITAAKQHFQVADIGEPVVIRQRQDWKVSSPGMTEEEAVGNAKRLLPADAIEVGMVRHGMGAGWEDDIYFGRECGIEAESDGGAGVWIRVCQRQIE